MHPTSSPMSPSILACHGPLFCKQGEIMMIDQSNNVYYLPCGDVCENGDDDFAEGPGIDSDDPETLEYEELGCFVDAKSRVLTGRRIEDSTMTNKVRESRRGLTSHESFETLSPRRCRDLDFHGRYWRHAHVNSINALVRQFLPRLRQHHKLPSSVHTPTGGKIAHAVAISYPAATDGARACICIESVEPWSLSCLRVEL